MVAIAVTLGAVMAASACGRVGYDPLRREDGGSMDGSTTGDGSARLDTGVGTVTDAGTIEGGTDDGGGVDGSTIATDGAVSPDDGGPPDAGATDAAALDGAVGEACRPTRPDACTAIDTMSVTSGSRELFLDVMYTHPSPLRGSCGGAGPNEYVVQVMVGDPGPYRFDVAGSDNAIAMYLRSPACGGEGAVELGCVVDTMPGPGGPSLVVDLTRGATVYVVMDGDGTCGAASFRVTGPPATF